jgi:hypothetical protein
MTKNLILKSLLEFVLISHLIPSPDCNENPFFSKKDCNGKQEKASENKLKCNLQVYFDYYFVCVPFRGLIKNL